MKHPLHHMMDARKAGKAQGIHALCSAHPLVLEICLRRAKEQNVPILIEATANQVNQFGGYTGQQPIDFYERVMAMADAQGLDRKQVILGGDHLGPLVWQDLPEKEAMARSDELIYLFAKAGFTKIHLDTSMKVADDPEGLLKTETIARRGAKLYKAAMRGYAERKQDDPSAMRPVFVIGSEVPIPGGAQEEEDSLAVTKAEDLRDTIATYARVFEEEGVKEGMADIIAVVTQPGVEFGDEQVFFYDREAAKELAAAIKEYPDYCLEGHSSDYQRPEGLKQMVEDGVAILKVGPALTFGLREALFSLSYMERELVPEPEQAKFIETLEAAMLEDPKNWIKHYHGSEKVIALARKYSFSDRARYYLGLPKVDEAIQKLFENLRKYPVPMHMLHQFMPLSYIKVRDQLIPLCPKELAMDGVTQFLLDYEYAIKP